MLDEELFNQIKAVSDRLAKIETSDRQKPSWDKAWSGLATVNYADLPPAAARGEMRYVADMGTVMAWDGARWASAIRLPPRAFMFADEAICTRAGCPGVTINAGQRYAYWAGLTGLVGDSFTHGFLARGGSYTFYALGVTMANGGIVQWSVDGVNFGALQDWYTPGATVLNVLRSDALNIVGDGYHVFRVLVVGKNPASGGGVTPLTKYWLQQAAD